MSTEEHMSVSERSDASLGDVPAGEAVDNDYTSRTGQKNAPVPVQSDNDAVEDPIDGETADSDAALGKALYLIVGEGILTSSPEKDDNDAIDTSNIIEGKTRGAAKPSGTYQEPGDNEGMPTQ
jgi:hypothetical protein